MTQQSPTISFSIDEALAIIMALELVAENSGISMTVNGQTYDVSFKYIKDIEPIRCKLFEFQLAQKDNERNY